MGNNDDIRLNQMGIAVMLLDPKQLPPQLYRKSALVGLSEGKKYVLKEQAKVFLQEIKQPLLRKHFCISRINSGEGIVVRVRKGHYDLSPYFKKAREVVELAKEELTDEKAKEYVGQVMRLANKLRGKRRSGKERLRPGQEKKK